MTTLNAAPSIATSTRGLSLDVSKLATPADPNAFASKLSDAQHAAHHDSSRSADHLVSKKLIDKPRADEAADDAQPAEPAAAERSPTKAEKPSDDRATDEADDAETSDEKADESNAAGAATTTDDALLAALAASAMPIATPPDATLDDATPTEPPAAPAAIATVAGTLSATDDSRSPATDAASATPAAAADPDAAKKGDPKLDALTAKLRPVDEQPASVPADAAERKGGEGRQPSSQQQASEDPGAALGKASEPATAATAEPDASNDESFDDLLSKLSAAAAMPTRNATPTPAPAQAVLRPEQQFAKDNVDRIVRSVQTQSTASGDGTMNVRLDPPELGALDVAARMLDGKMSLSFTTSNDQATQLLSHNLSHLKSSLESVGITVDRIEVRQRAATSAGGAPADRDSSGQPQQGKGFDAPSQQQGEQQRKQMVEKLWRKYAYGNDEVDLVA